MCFWYDQWKRRIQELKTTKETTVWAKLGTSRRSGRQTLTTGKPVVLRATEGCPLRENSGGGDRQQWARQSSRAIPDAHVTWLAETTQPGPVRAAKYCDDVLPVRRAYMRPSTGTEISRHGLFHRRTQRVCARTGNHVNKRVSRAMVRHVDHHRVLLIPRLGHLRDYWEVRPEGIDDTVHTQTRSLYSGLHSVIQLPCEIGYRPLNRIHRGARFPCRSLLSGEVLRVANRVSTQNACFCGSQLRRQSRHVVLLFWKICVQHRDLCLPRCSTRRDLRRFLTGRSEVLFQPLLLIFTVEPYHDRI